MARIELQNVQKFFGALQVLRDINLVIEDGEFVVMLGQSGCGKTTTLRAIAGLETVSSGTITILGLIGFLVTSHIPPEPEVEIEEEEELI